MNAVLRWQAWVPLLGLALGVFGGKLPESLAVASTVSVLVFVVLAAVYHAEVIAERVGEPYGTLVLAVAVTIIEVALIISLMLSGDGPVPTLVRDTVFAAVMIIITGMVGLCLLSGALSHGEQTFTRRGVSAALATLTALSVLTLVLPNFTTSAPGGAYSMLQLAFVGFVSLVLYGAFVFIQTIKHRDYLDLHCLGARARGCSLVGQGTRAGSQQPSSFGRRAGGGGRCIHRRIGAAA
jgi:Ca2+:H+ antiporter